MTEQQIYDLLKTELNLIKGRLDDMSIHIKHLETEIAFLKGKSEGFNKFKDTLYVGYMVIITGIAVWSLFVK